MSPHGRLKGEFPKSHAVAPSGSWGTVFCAEGAKWQSG